MTPLAIAHKKLKGDLSNSYLPRIGNKFLYIRNDGMYVTFTYPKHDSINTYISTVEEFNNFKGDDMKTVMDAVNLLKANLTKNFVFESTTSVPWWGKGQLIAENTNPDCTMFSPVCTRDEFLATVAECETNFGKCEPPTYTQEMADNGVLPPIDSEYLDEDGQPCKALLHYGSFVIGEMIEHIPTSQYQVLSTSRNDRVKPLTPPIELIDGKAYQFDYVNKPCDGTYHGLFNAKLNRFIIKDGFVAADYTLNIQPLTVEVK